MRQLIFGISKVSLRRVSRQPMTVARESFLSLKGIYESVAETLPDVRDDTFDPDVDIPTVSCEVPELMDPYAKILGAKTVKKNTKKSKKKRKLKRKGAVEVNADRKAAFQDQVRFLPPGAMKDYHEQFNSAYPRAADKKPVAFSTFWRVWSQEFPFMKIRATSNHAQCTTCIRHKLLIRGMNGHLNARKLQVEQYVQHLRAQYQDRLLYWDLRGVARDKTPFETILILDGMDQGKFAFPRSDLFRSKDLAGFSRPRAHIAGCILHGRLVLFTVSPSTLPKDANAAIETTAHCLHLLSKHISLRRLVLNIQADNTPREVKNNHYLRWLCSLVSRGTWHSELSTLVPPLFSPVRTRLLAFLCGYTMRLFSRMCFSLKVRRSARNSFATPTLRAQS